MVFDRPTAEAMFARRLLPVARRWRQAADLALKDVGLSDADGWVLVHVSRVAEGIHQRALADLVDISGASLVRRLDQLQSAGLIERRADPDDRRANYVTLTGRGRILADRIERAFAALRRTLLIDVNDGELRAVNDMLDRLDERIVRHRNDAR